MKKRDRWKRHPVLEGLEGRLPPSSLTPGAAPHEVRHHGDGYPKDNGNWEPKPISNSSSRPTLPNDPVPPVR